jgi:hypothetical protein
LIDVILRITPDVVGQRSKGEGDAAGVGVGQRVAE